MQKSYITAIIELFIDTHRLENNQSTLLRKIDEAGQNLRILCATLNDVSMNFRKLDRDVNTCRPEIMQLQAEKQTLTE